MKNVIKGMEPPLLTSYRTAYPRSTWEMMRRDRITGKDAYKKCREDSISQQGGLCAYCECDISDNNHDKCRVEHFHPRSDRTTTHNYALDWQNMLGVCNGGSKAISGDSDLYLLPSKTNQSCDTHKNTMIQVGNLVENCNGYILNPLLISAFPSLFSINKTTGELKPGDAGIIDQIQLPHNNYQTTTELVDKTIKYLNLNCDRLTQARKKVILAIEKEKQEQRTLGNSPEQTLDNLCHKHFQKCWQKFFTTRRLCLAPRSDLYLQTIGYQG